MGQWSPETEQRLIQLDQLLQAQGVDLETLENNPIARLNFYQGMIKNSDDEPELVDMTSVELRPKPTAEYPNPFITQAQPVNIPRSTAKPVQRDFRLIASIPDEQIGYRFIDGEYVPLHDEAAMTVAKMILRDYKPDLVVKAGDTGDLGEVSKHDPDSDHLQHTMQATIDRAHLWNEELRAVIPGSRIVELEGNHNRITKFVLKHAMQLYNIKQANLPDSWPVVSWPYLTRMDESGVEWVSGYPANEFWAADDLVFIHGNTVNSRGSTAARLSEKYPDANVVFGHVHSHQLHTRTTRRGEYLTAATFGTLARIDGVVPSYWNGVDDHNKPVVRYENWQQGIGLISDYGNGSYQFDPIFIRDGVANYRGKEYSAWQSETT